MRVAILAVLSVALVSAEPVTFTVAYEDQPLPPYIMPDGTGSDFARLRTACTAAGVALQLEMLPWRRCLSQLEAGRVDAVLNASFKAERAVYALYPRDAAGEPDASRALHQLTYALYRRRGDPLAWDGKALLHLTGDIGAQTAFSIIDRLKELGATVDDGSKEHTVVLRKLAFGRLQGAALLTDAADAALVFDADLGKAIERVDPPIESKPYYLIIGKRFGDAHPGLADRIWDGFKAK